MRPHLVAREELGSARVDGLVLCEELRDEAGHTALRKGQVLHAADLPVLGQLPWRELHLIEPEPGELHEEEAGRRIAAAAAGDGIEVRAFAGGHWPLVATRRGVLDVSAAALRDVNCIEGACVYTLFDGQIVDAGEVAARAKVTPFVLHESRVRELEAIAREHSGLVRVRAFHPARIGAIVQERLGEHQIGRFRDALAEKVAWFGAELIEPWFVEPDEDAIAAAVRELLRVGAQIVVFAGTKAMDPLDPAFLALERLGTSLELHGIPAHPGSLLWLAYLDGVPLVGMPTCGLFSQATTFDLILPRLLIGERPRRTQLAELGHGGLLTKEMGFRFPRYRAAQLRGEVE